MTKICHLTLHYKSQEKDEKKASNRSETYTLKIETENISTSIPDASRKSLYDAVKFNELQNWLSLQTQLNKITTEEDHLKILEYLRYSFAYRGYNFFNAEYAEAVRLYLIEQNGSPEYEPKPTEVFERMVSRGFFPHRKPAEIKSVYEELNFRVDKSSGSYNKKYINEAPYQPYFRKLGVYEENNGLAPQDYLLQNFNSASPSEPLLHVRECEDIGCSINPRKSPFTEFMSRTARKIIVDNFIDTDDPHDETPFYYCGFASGLLLRDLGIINDLISDTKKKNMELFFIDKSYATFIKTVVEEGEPGMEQHVDATFFYKTITEFAHWTASRLESSNENPLTIHLFSDAADAELYFKNTGKKLTLRACQKITFLCF